MKMKVGIFVMLAVATGIANAESLLQVASFPKTFADVPFVDRMAIKSEGYDGFESVYDSNGRCISGCAYTGITLEDELNAIQRATDLANFKMAQYRQQYPNEFNQPAAPNARPSTTSPNDWPVLPGSDTTPATQPSSQQPVNNGPTKPTSGPTYPSMPTAPTTPQQPSPTSQPVRDNTPGMCTYRTSQIVPRDVINQTPLTYPYRISSRFGPRKSFTTTNGNQSTSIHQGIDMAAPNGTDVYAAANGIVTNVQNQPNGCGLWIQIEHENGFSTQYCHLSQQLVKVNDRVQAGCLIGKVGSTGNVSGPHLHYVVKQNGVPINPEPYLN